MTVAAKELDRPAPNLAAWIIVGVCFLALAVSFSARSSLSQIMDPLQKELGWSRSTVSGAASLAQIFMAIASPIMGNLVDRFGPRFLLSGGLLAIGGGVLLATGAETPWQFYLAYSFIAGIGFGTAATHLVSTTVSLTFTRNRGLAIGIATAGATVGQFVLIPILGRMLEYTDWRTSYMALGIATLAVAPVVLAVIRPARGAAAPVRKAAIAEPMAVRLLYLFRSRTFHLLFWSYFICGITTSGVIEAHLIPYSVFCGFTVPASSDAFAILMVFNLGGMVLAGWLADRMNRPLLLGSIYVLRSFSFILLLLLVDNPSYETLIAFAVIFGVFDYSTVPVTASLAASHLGLRILGLAMGLLTAGHALGAAVGAQMGGVIFDLFATYAWTWWIALVVALFAGFLSYLIREQRGIAGLAPTTA
ncbi:MAG: MFS transporter [Dongiaceae bacterium]